MKKYLAFKGEVHIPKYDGRTLGFQFLFCEMENSVVYAVEDIYDSFMDEYQDVQDLDVKATWAWKLFMWLDILIGLFGLVQGCYLRWAGTFCNMGVSALDSSHYMRISLRVGPFTFDTIDFIFRFWPGLCVLIKR